MGEAVITGMCSRHVRLCGAHQLMGAASVAGAWNALHEGSTQLQQSDVVSVYKSIMSAKVQSLQEKYVATSCWDLMWQVVGNAQL